MIPIAETAEIEAAAPRSVALGNDGETVDVWEYFAMNIDDFATAKTLVDYFAANPRHLDNGQVDTLGLYLRAGITLKRQQIAYAQAQATIEKARQTSRSILGVVRSTASFVRGAISAIEANPTPALTAGALALLIWFR